MNIVETTRESAAEKIADEMNALLASGSVLWLVSGGSNIGLAVEVRNLLQIANQLTVGLIDERYGPEGHADSNWKQLLDAGFNVNEISVLPVLHNEPIEVTAANYSVMLSNAVKDHDCVVGLFGMGADGHTSGILPGSAAVNSKDTVAWYIADDHERVTTTPLFFNKIGMAYLAAFGESKRVQLERLTGNLSVSEQPAQALKKIPHLTIYTDQKLGGLNG